MAPVVVKCVVSYSSQDSVHKVDNLLTAQGGSWKRWLCASDDRSGVMEAELQLDRAYHIGYVDIGNCGSAYVELLVGRSSWNRSQEYVTLLPATMFMNPMESKAGKNKMVVRMFNESLLSEEGRSEMWDRVRIICRQPFRKDMPFGLSFLRLRTPNTDVPTSSPQSPRVAVSSVTKAMHNSSSRRESTAPPQTPGTEASVSTEWNESIESTKSRLLKMAGTSEDGSEHLGRSARMVVAAASKQKNRQTKGDRTADTPAGVVNQFEVLKFLGSLDFTKMDMDNVMYSDLKTQYKQILGRKLTTEEKRVFLQTTQQYLEQYFSQTKDSAGTKQQANGGSTKHPGIEAPSSEAVSVLKDTSNKTNTQRKNTVTPMKLPSTEVTPKRGRKRKQPSLPQPLPTTAAVEVNNADSALTSRQLRASFLASIVDRRDGNQPCEQIDDIAEASCSKPTPKRRGRKATSAAGSAKKRAKRCNRSMYPVGDTQVMDEEPSCSQSSSGSQPHSAEASAVLAECPICEGKYPSYIIEAHASECTGDSPDDDLPSPSKPCGSRHDDYYMAPTRLVTCPICSVRFPPSVIQDHANACADRDVICMS
ncbi:uncharacterized protein LOC118423557 [Branchiostoma floridae]|uniref:Uncharacterized protein LOC118423557 n=1 Tax=Branchiostoma floridae TaxID=7739 RepID=C3ZLG4_BRAFL|nr:uncharacterized protein LOC118423557 [Branchiostoma floridae]|eukprot:XP_002590590.1 hypothetical protein BRAFLDRAFT_123617 [Branchiostoma floridae]